MSKIWTAKDIEDFEAKFNVDCTLRPDGMYNVGPFSNKSSLDISRYCSSIRGYVISDLTEILPPIHTLHGNFDCVEHHIKNLKGSPLRVIGYFNVEYNKLESIEGAPEYIEYTFYIGNNENLIITKYDLERYRNIEYDPYQLLSDDPKEFIKKGILPI